MFPSEISSSINNSSQLGYTEVILLVNDSLNGNNTSHIQPVINESKYTSVNSSPKKMEMIAGGASLAPKR